MVKKRIGTIVDIMMYALLLVQMLYIFSGNTLHEILGILFFLCLIVHLLIKGWWFKTLFKKGKSRDRRFSDTLTVLLLLSAATLMLSSMGVSRLLFPWFHPLRLSNRQSKHHHRNYLRSKCLCRSH